MKNISWTVYNEEVFAMIEQERAIIRTIRKRQKKWIGHMLRGDSLLRTVIKEKKLMEENRRKRHRRRLVKNIGWAKPK